MTDEELNRTRSREEIEKGLSKEALKEIEEFLAKSGFVMLTKSNDGIVWTLQFASKSRLPLYQYKVGSAI